MICSSKSEAAILLLLLGIFAKALSQAYDEVRPLEVSCYPKDLCHPHDLPQAQKDETEGNTCECDRTCYKRGTCCIDSPYLKRGRYIKSEICSGERIAGVRHYYNFTRAGVSFYQATKCNSRWRGSAQVQQLCELTEPVDGTDVIAAIPVTNTNSGVTYKNLFCALCNNDLEGSVFLDFAVRLDDLLPLYESFQLQAVNAQSEGSSDTKQKDGTDNGINLLHVVYNRAEGSYGFWDDFSSNSSHFVPVEVRLGIPYQIKDYIKGCRPDMVSHCAPGWEGTLTQQRCEEYLGIIKGPIKFKDGRYQHYYFRNVHCAICNNVKDFRDYSCEPFSVGDVTIGITYPTSLTLLLGHLLSDKGCLKANEIFVKGLGCRSVVCPHPRYQVKEGKCVDS